MIAHASRPALCRTSLADKVAIFIVLCLVHVLISLCLCIQTF